MSSAAILIGPPALGELARRWVTAGLMGPLVWIDGATANVPMDAVGWQGVEGTMCDVDGAYAVRIQETLASAGALRGIAVAWVRDDTEDVSAGMGSVSAFAQRIIHQNTAPRLFDIVAPTRADGVDASVHAQGWEQVVAVPEDRPEVESPDAGWVDKRVAVLLHVAAAALGRLGGFSAPFPAGDNSAPRMVSVWSRHGLGAETLRREAVELLDRRLPGFCAPDVKPQQYAIFAEQWDHAKTMLDWLQHRRNGQLSYARPAPKPILDSDAGTAVPATPVTEGRRGVAADEAPGGASERERRWCEDAHEKLKAIRTSDGDLPPGGLWRDVVQLLTASVDGGELPEEFRPKLAHGHVLVVQADVAGPDRELTLGNYPAHEKDVPELAHRPPEPLAGKALVDAADELWADPGGGVMFPVSTVGLSGRQRALVDDLVEKDRVTQKAQRGPLLAVGLGTDPAERSVADALWTSILTDAIRSRLDAERWHEAAVSDWPMAPRRVASASLAGWVLAGLMALLGAGWLIDGDTMNSVVARIGIGPWDPIVAGAVSLAAAAGIAVAAYLLRPRGVDDEYWRWRMTLRVQLRHRAEDAYRSTRRLDNALRIYGYWWLVLRDLFPVRGAEAGSGAETELVVPRALQHGPVEVHAPYRDLVLSQAGVEPGWRGAAVGELAGLALAKYADVAYDDVLSAVFEDSGYGEGPLHRLQRDLAGAWVEFRALWIERAVLEAKNGLVGPTSKIGGDHHPQLLTSFFDEVRHKTAPRLWPGLRGADQSAERTWESSTHPADGASPAITPAIPALASAVLVVLRPLHTAGTEARFGREGDLGYGVLSDDDDAQIDPF